MMVLFQFLLSFTPESRARDLAILKNPPAMLNHVLLPANVRRFTFEHCSPATQTQELTRFCVVGEMD